MFCLYRRGFQEELVVSSIRFNFAGDSIKGVLLLLIELAIHSVELDQSLFRAKHQCSSYARVGFHLVAITALEQGLPMTERRRQVEHLEAFPVLFELSL